jgi:2,4-dienoyl-CoA reductase-like NADH-dependent reductase (Old Yellow Enzyme family)
MSPLEYPSLHANSFIPPLKSAIEEIKKAAPDCRYIIQIGDTGGHTHTSAFPQSEDGLSSSAYTDLLYGYRNRTQAMTVEQIAQAVRAFAEAARRVRETGSDGIEITASKGYLLHQFLNPGVNRRRDRYGGSVDNRFRIVEEVISEVRRAVGDDFLLGVRLSAKDYNYLPLNIRFPIAWPLRHHFIGNDLHETVHYGRRLEALGVDYLHIDSGFGFPNPKGSPGNYPDAGFKIFVNANRYLSFKAQLRAFLFNVVPGPIRRAAFGFGWRYTPAANAMFAAAIRRAVTIPVIANGGFQDRDVIESALRGGACDMIAMARPLLANVDLLQQFKAGRNSPKCPCSFCSECCARTALFPLGCYDLRRFCGSQEKMMDQVMAWSSPDA